MRKPYVSVIIPTFNDTEKLKLCLKALEKQSYPSDRFEVIIINNNPSSKIFIGKINLIHKILTERKSGSYSARNKGILNSNGEIIAFTDSDCIPKKDWINNSIKHLCKYDDLDRIAGRIELFYKSKERTLVEKYESIFAFNQKKNAIKGTSVTANMISRKKVFDKVGLFDDSLKSGADFEWGIRAQKSGYKIKYKSNVVVKHPARYSIKELFKKQKRIMRGTFLKNYKKEKSLNNLVALFKGLFPPFYSILPIYNHQEYNVLNKLLLILLLYIKKIYSSYLIFTFLFISRERED